MSILKSMFKFVLVIGLLLLIAALANAGTGKAVPYAGCVSLIVYDDGELLQTWNLTRQLQYQQNDAWLMKCKYVMVQEDDSVAPLARCVNSIVYDGGLLKQTWTLIYQKMLPRVPAELVCLYQLSEIIGDPKPIPQG